MSLAVVRDMRERGFDVTVAFWGHAGGFSQPDPADDFRATGRLINLSNATEDTILNLPRSLLARGDCLVVQCGAALLYQFLPYWRELYPRLRIIDMLYNEVGHTVNHFLYERSFHGVIVESAHMKRFMQEGTANVDPNIHLVESGSDLVEFAPPPDRVSRGGPPVLGYVGRMSDEKNPLGFVTLCEALHARMPELTFKMFGEGRMAAQVRQRIASGSAATAIDYAGYVGDIRDAFRQIDVLVLPSKIDGRPNVIMEANACGLPVLAAPVGGVPEMIEAGVNGYLASPTDVAKIAELVRGWAADPAAIPAMARRARAHAEAKFDRRRMMADYEAAFRGLLPGVDD
jgi:glycosyltransferase involved in cell wall biosynthesis